MKFTEEQIKDGNIQLQKLIDIAESVKETWSWDFNHPDGCLIGICDSRDWNVKKSTFTITKKEKKRIFFPIGYDYEHEDGSRFDPTKYTIEKGCVLEKTCTIEQAIENIKNFISERS